MPLRKTIYLIVLSLIIGLTAYYFYPEQPLPSNAKIDKIVVIKSKRQMLVYSKTELLKAYKISLGNNPTGDKQIEGDKKTPEGFYTINDKNPRSDYYKNLGVSYPNQRDIEEAKKLGKPAGGDIKIHGLRNGTGIIHKFQRWFDWTMGCIALTNDDMEEIYNHTAVGTPIEIRK